MASLTTFPASAGAWSKSVNGLAARLLAEIEEVQPGLRCAITLSLRNESPEPIAVTNQPQVQAGLHDASGSPVRSATLAMSGPLLPAQWAVIPGDACLAFRVDLRTAGVPVREQGLLLVALGDKGWTVSAGSYLLGATIAYEKRSDALPNQWAGTLELPQVPIEVPASLFAVN